MSGQGRPDPLLCGLIAWVLPGAGHLMLGLKARGAQFFSAIAVTFALGLAVTRGHAVSFADHPLALILQAPAGVLTLGGVLFDLSRPAVTGPRIPADEVVALLDLGLLFTMAAGLLNILVVFDAWDRARGKA